MTMRPIIPTIALLLAGCATAPGTGTYPSLAKRPIESGGTSASAPAPTPAVTTPGDDTALTDQVARLTAQAREGAATFDKGFPDAERQAQAAAKSAVSSDAWVNAQIAVSALESARNDCVSALAALDTLYAERANAQVEGQASGGTDMIDTARQQVLAIVDSQNDRLDRIKALLPQA
jgi:hypothetical protein